MRNYITVFLIMLSAIVVDAQQSNQFYIDSLRHKLTFAKADTNKVKLLFRVVDWYNDSSADSGIAYTEEALDLAEKINFENSLFSDYPAAS